MKSVLWVAALMMAGMVQAAAPVASGRVLLVVSSEGRDGGKTRPGFEMGELAQAYLVLRANGLVVDIASPTGGAVVADRFNQEADHIKPFLADTDAQRLLQNTRRTQDVKVGEHRAIMVIGGKGPMFDLPKDTALQKLLAQHYEGGGILAAVCHGPAALAHVTLADGTALVKGRRMTGFTNEEEAAFGEKWTKEFPWLLETRMRDSGALWEEAALMMPKLVVDGRLITGQNPFSTAQTAEAIVRGLGGAPVKRTVYRDEASMLLVERWLAGEKPAVKRAIETAPNQYKTELIAMLGYYHFKAATDDTARRQALSVMELAEPYIDHPKLNPKLQLGIAQAEAALGNVTTARERLTRLVASKPDFDDAKKMLAALPAR